MSVDVTEGDAACDVFIRPCTIQGCRPLSVRSHPAVFMRNGAMANHGAIKRNHLALPSVLRRMSQSPHSANSAMSAAM